ncbi:hypothetical protein E4K72_02025 [Oxalobacteraceae bacterium OM1]|nr:hypothetical protein E4K72_02025 [Oxalobacteraceae bacterium OM1]
MQPAQLEDLASRLQHLRDALTRRDGGDRPIAEDDPLLEEARACDFMLPEPLTEAALAHTVQHKLENVAVLLERARRHASLPRAAQVAAEQEYLATDEDLRAAPPQA